MRLHSGKRYIYQNRALDRVRGEHGGLYVDHVGVERRRRIDIVAGGAARERQPEAPAFLRLGRHGGLASHGCGERGGRAKRHGPAHELTPADLPKREQVRIVL